MISLLAVPQLMNLCRFLSLSVLWCNSSQLDSVEKGLGSHIKYRRMWCESAHPVTIAYHSRIAAAVLKSIQSAKIPWIRWFSFLYGLQMFSSGKGLRLKRVHRCPQILCKSKPQRTLLADVLNATERLCILLGSRIHVPDLRSISSWIKLNQADLLTLCKCSPKCPHWVLKEGVKPGFGQASFSGLQLLTAPARAKVPLWDVRVHFDCAASRNARGWFCSLLKVYFYRRRAHFLS